MDYHLTTASMIIGVTFGLVMPVLANYLPIKAAMGVNLRTSLDLSRRTDSEIGVKIKTLDSIGIDTNQLIVSFLLIIIGFSTYYLVPYAYMNDNIALFNTILDMLLVLIMLGLTMICVLLFPFLEYALLWTTLHTCCRRDKKLLRIIDKNMQGHRKRNSKTSLMFTLSISFLIFSASSFELLSTLLEKSVTQYIGADLNGMTAQRYIVEKPIKDFLDQ
jgi:NADH:ubiquinone oxidoreductase subunit 3 (subunit A)